MPRAGDSRASQFHVKVLVRSVHYLSALVRAVMRSSVSLNQLQF